jgi:hypothetical protein
LGGGYTIPNGVTNIGSAAFFACQGLQDVTIPDTVIGPRFLRRILYLETSVTR